MKYNYLKGIVFFALLFLSIGAVSGQIERPIGTNLTGVQDWSTEFVFVDVMKQCRQWIPHNLESGGPWDSGVEIPLGTNGYPLEIPYDNGVDPIQGIRTVMFADLENIYPNGAYRVISEGVGIIELWGAASVTFNSPIDTLIELNNTSGILGLEILESSVTNPIHDIHIVMPGFHNTFEDEPFHPELLDFLQDFQVIRFMDWMKTNGSIVQEWSDRNVPDYFSQTLNNGISYEYIIEISNLLQRDLWINIPHQASDEYVTQLAQMLRDEVDSELKIYIEYSNEVWNSIFPQNQYAAEAATELGYEGEPWDLSWQYTARRSADIFHLFENEFENNDRLVKIIPGFAANSWVNNFILERFNNNAYNLSGVTADALAIAPYFGGVANTIGDAGLENSITIEAILDSMENSLPQSYLWMEENKELADQYDLDLVAYEGGQHLVAYYPYNENEAFVEKLLDANRHPRMQELYCSYFDYWYDNVGGGLFAHFSSHGGYSRHGAWGVKETYDDINAPKYLGLQECVFSYNMVPNTIENASKNSTIEIYPSPVYDHFLISGLENKSVINVYNIHGALQLHIETESSDESINIGSFTKGMYFVHISNSANQDVSVMKIVKQ